MTAAVILMLFAAPAPAPRAAPVPAIACGQAVMTWKGIDCEAYFHGDGVFACLWRGKWWQGRWSQAGGVLAVEEWPLGEEGRVLRWSVKLSGPTAGDMDGHPWRVRPLASGRVD